MSQDEINRLNARIATLEKQNQAKPNLAELRRLLVLDPQSFFTTIGLSAEEINHVDTVSVVKTLGDSAPLQMKMAAASGPQLIASQTQAQSVADLSRQVAELTKAQAAKARGEEFQAITAKASEYPHLSKAAKANPALFKRELEAHGGTAEEFAKAKEESLAEIAAALGVPTAPQEKPAGGNSPSTGSVKTPDSQDQSKKVASALSDGAINGTPAPSSASKEGKWNDSAFQALKQKIIANTPKQ